MGNRVSQGIKQITRSKEAQQQQSPQSSSVVLPVGIDGKPNELFSKKDGETKENNASNNNNKYNNNNNPGMSEKSLETKTMLDAHDSFSHGNTLFRQGQFALAKDHYEVALIILCHLEPNNGEITKASALSNMAFLEYCDGRYDAAKGLLQEALALRKSSFAKKPLSEQQTANYESIEVISMALAQDYHLHKLTNEQQIFVKELKKHGQIDAVIADTINNLAACYEVLGDMDAAQPLYEESLQLRKVVCGENSLKVAESMQNLATIMDSKGFLCEAEELLRHSLNIQISIVGVASPEAATSQNNLGVLLCHLGKLNEAKNMLQEAYDTRLHYFGDVHSLTVCAWQNLTYVQNKIQSLHDKSLVDNVHLDT